MEYCIVSPDTTITNIIVCAGNDTAARFGAVPFYDGARIGDHYAPPEPEPIQEPPKAQQMQAAIRLSMMQAQALPDAQALAVPELYPAWAAGTAYGGEGQTQIVSRPNGYLYRCRQAHTSQVGWEPENVPALWVVIANGEAGSQDEPITAARGMEYKYGKYYKDPEDGKIYLCTRTGESEGGTVVLQYLPHELIGHYFQEAQYD